MKQNPASDFPAIQHLPKKREKIGINQNVTLNGQVMRSVFRKCLRNADSLVKTRLSAFLLKAYSVLLPKIGTALNTVYSFPRFKKLSNADYYREIFRFAQCNIGFIGYKKSVTLDNIYIVYFTASRYHNGNRRFV